MVWFVRYLFDGSARRYRIGQHPAVGLSAARKLASVVRGRVAAGDDPQSEKRAKREAARRRRLLHTGVRGRRLRLGLRESHERHRNGGQDERKRLHVSSP